MNSAFKSKRKASGSGWIRESQSQSRNTNISIEMEPSMLREERNSHGDYDADSSFSSHQSHTNTYQYPDTYFDHRILQPFWLVQTPYGVGTVVACLACEAGEFTDDDEDIEVDVSHKVSGHYKYHIRLSVDSDSSNSQSRLVTFENYPSIEPSIGSDVVLTCFNASTNHSLQRGRVIELRPLQRQAVVRLVSWRLSHANGSSSSKSKPKARSEVAAPSLQNYTTVSFVTCYVSYNSLQVVCPTPISAMSLYDTLLYIHERQHLAYEEYRLQRYTTSYDLYESTVTAIRSVLMERQAPDIQPIRGNLIFTQIRCSNQAALCCLQNRNFQGVVGHAMNALKLLRSLEKKRNFGDGEEAVAVSKSSSYGGWNKARKQDARTTTGTTTTNTTNRDERKQFDRFCGEMRVFGVWRIKSMQLMTFALVSFSQWDHVEEICLQAHKIVSKYTTQVSPNTCILRKSSIREYFNRKEQLLRVDKSLLRLYVKVEQRRRYLSNMTYRSILVPETKLDDTSQCGISTLEDDIDADWLDQDEAQEMADDWHPVAVVVEGLVVEKSDVLVMPSPIRCDRPEDNYVEIDNPCDFSKDEVSFADCSASSGFIKERNRNLSSESPVSQIVKPKYLDRTFTNSNPCTPMKNTVSEAAVPPAVLNASIAISPDSDSSIRESSDGIFRLRSIEAFHPTSTEAQVVTPTIKLDWNEFDADLSSVNVASSAIAEDTDVRMVLAANRIQTLFRVVNAQQFWKARQLERRVAACTIQKWYRCVLNLRECTFVQNAWKFSATKIQSVHRCRILRARHLQNQSSAVVAQTSIRRFLSQRRYTQRKCELEASSNKIRACYTSCLQRKVDVHYLQSSKKAAIKIQTSYRCRVLQLLYLQRKIAIVVVQAVVRSFLAQQAFLRTKCELMRACLAVQICYRRYRVNQLLQENSSAAAASNRLSFSTESFTNAVVDEQVMKGSKKYIATEIDSDSVRSSASHGTNPFYDATSQVSLASDIGSRSDGQCYSSASSYLGVREGESKVAASRRAFVDPILLEKLRARSASNSDALSHRKSLQPMIIDDDEKSALSDNASQATSISAYFDAASQQSDGDVSDTCQSFKSGISRTTVASTYSQFSVISAPAFVRSEKENVEARIAGVSQARNVFVDATTLKKLQKRSRSKAAITQSGQRKPVIASHLLKEVSVGGRVTSMREQGRFEPVYEELPDDNWRDEMKVFAPVKETMNNRTKASITYSKPKSRDDGKPRRDAHVKGLGDDAASVGGSSEGAVTIGGATYGRRGSLAQSRNVFFSEDFRSHRFEDGRDSSVFIEQNSQSSRRAWYTTRDLRAGMGTLVTSGASIGSMIASKLMNTKECR